MGGTFDHLHAGHKVLLTVSAVLASESVVCGLADGPLLANKKFADLLESYDVRKKHVEEFFNIVRPSIRIEVVALIDVGGPTLNDPTITGLVVSLETEKSAQLINEARQKKGFGLLHVTTISLISNHPSLAADGQNKISSTSIRESKKSKV